MSTDAHTTTRFTDDRLHRGLTVFPVLCAATLSLSDRQSYRLLQAVERDVLRSELVMVPPPTSTGSVT